MSILHTLTSPLTAPLTSPLTARRGGGGSWLPTELFQSGEQGAWYDPSDSSTMFQDAAGTTPVTAVGQPVGRILDKSGRGNHAAQATTTKRPILPAAGYRLRSDFVDDALPVTLPAFDGEVWVNTPYGHYMTTRSASTATDYRLPLNDATEIIIRAGTTTQEQRDALSAYFGNGKAPYGSIMLSPDTSIGINSYAVGAETPAVIRYIGANGVSVEKTYPTGNVTTTYDLAADGLTAPVAMILLNTGARYFYCNSNQLTGSIPSLSANTALTSFYCHVNQLTGSIPSLSANTALTSFQCNTNQLTGSIPSLSSNTALTSFQCNANQLTGSIPSLSSNTALTTFYCYNNQLTDAEAGFAVAPSLGNFQAQNNNLTAAAVNTILAAFVAAGRTSANGVVTLNLGGNAAPTGQGLTDKTTLQSRGWTVTTN